MNYVLTRYYSSWECSGVINECIVYDGSLEDLKIEFEIWWKENYGKSHNEVLPIPSINALILNPNDFCDRGNYEEPRIQTLDDWFVAKANGED